MPSLSPSNVAGGPVERRRRIATDAEPNAERYPLWHQFGLSHAEIAARRHLLCLHDVEHQELARIHAAIRGSVDAVVEDFYSHLRHNETLRNFFKDELTLERLKRSMRMYLLTLGCSIESPAYIEDRLRIGLVHERIGLPQHWYLGSISVLFASISRQLAMQHSDTADQLVSLLSLLHRLLSFDTTFVVDTYTAAAHQRLTQLIEQLTATHKQLETMSQLDGLTGILNRTALMRNLEDRVRASARHEGRFALLLLDIDFFKNVNDTWGHKAGDLVILSLVSAVQRAVRSGDIVGRLGGEEFAIGLPGITMEEALHIAERIRRHIEAARVTLPRGGDVGITISLGAACVAHGDDTLDALLDRADRALFQAKRNGRNRVCFAEKADGAATQILEQRLF